MGYTTYFTGSVSVDPPLNTAQVQELNEFADERHGGNREPYEGFPGFWCKWRPTDDGTAIEWDGAEKFYDSVEWMQYLIDNFLEPNGYTVEGTIDAQGEEPGDIWRLKVENNVAKELVAKITYEERK